MSEFVDECLVCVKGGDGGAGCVSFRREAHVSKGGPNGGDGGSGGSVWLEASRSVSSLLAFRDNPHLKAGRGDHGHGSNMHGSAGEDNVVAVPEGTVVFDLDGEILADLRSHGDRWMAAEGGRGGQGNARFLSNKMRVPKFAEQGEVALERWLRLELRLLADVALVGFPNAGKSTLISRVSAAKPKIASYPFTTLTPNLGVYRRGDFEMTIADIPGLIEGAAQGRGLGIQFLKHTQRARVLLMMIDLSSSAVEEPQRQYEVLSQELASFSEQLAQLPRVIAGSRCDVGTPITTDQYADICKEMNTEPIVFSSVTGTGVPQMMGALTKEVETSRDTDVEVPRHTIWRPASEPVFVDRADDGSFVVGGREALRAVGLSDITSPEAQIHLEARLKRSGVVAALRAEGISEGDVVTIGDLSFEWSD